MQLSVSALALLWLSIFLQTFAAADDQVDVPLDKQTAETLANATESKNLTLQSHAYFLLSKSKEISRLLDAKVIESCIHVSLRSESRSIVGYGFEILDNASLPKDDKQRLLFNAIDFPKAQQSAFTRLTCDREELLPKIIDELGQDFKTTPNKIRVNRIRLLEHWGPDAKAAVPVLISNYESLRNQEIEKQRKRYAKRQLERERDRAERLRNKTPDQPVPVKLPKRDFDPAKLNLKFEYLHIVFALAAIGPDAKPAMSIASAAIKEASNKSRKNRETYALAGMLCLERILDTPGPKLNRRFNSLLGNVQGRAMIGNAMGGTRASFETSSPTIRRTVESHLALLAKVRTANNTKQIEEKVALVFQNHDLLTEKEKLTIEEVRNIEPPILFTKVDSNSDQSISKEELRQYFVEKAKSQSRTRRSR